MVLAKAYVMELVGRGVLDVPVAQITKKVLVLLDLLPERILDLHLERANHVADADQAVAVTAVDIVAVVAVAVELVKLIVLAHVEPAQLNVLLVAPAVVAEVVSKIALHLVTRDVHLDAEESVQVFVLEHVRKDAIVFAQVHVINHVLAIAPINVMKDVAEVVSTLVTDVLRLVDLVLVDVPVSV